MVSSRLTRSIPACHVRFLHFADKLTVCGGISQDTTEKRDTCFQNAVIEPISTIPVEFAFFVNFFIIDGRMVNAPFP